jgi:hypothetical protein
MDVVILPPVLLLSASQWLGDGDLPTTVTDTTAAPIKA